MARSTEGPMEWEFTDNTGPLDPHSPFTHLHQVQKNVNAASSMHNYRFPTPPKLLPSFPAAPPLRNPAFTTPRHSVDADASGAESSPGGQTEASDVPNDTPETERFASLSLKMPGLTARVDKTARYGRGGQGSRRKQLSGRGDLARPHRLHAATDPIRKRARHANDLDVGGVRNHSPQRWDGDDESDYTGHGDRDGRLAHGADGGGIVTSFLGMLDRHPNAPERLYNWSRLLFNLILLAGLGYFVWTVADALRNDINTANAEARAGVMAQIAECERNYRQNECDRKDRPALVDLCNGWYECMIRDPDAIMRFKTFVRHIAEVMNVFAGTMHLKAWGFFFAIMLFCIMANNLTLGRYGGGPSASAKAVPQNYVFLPPSRTPRSLSRTSQTPHDFFLGQGSDTDDGSPLRRHGMMVSTSSAAATPSRRRSPAKLGRAPSPDKRYS